MEAWKQDQWKSLWGEKQTFNTKIKTKNPNIYLKKLLIKKWTNKLEYWIINDMKYKNHLTANIL